MRPLWIVLLAFRSSHGLWKRANRLHAWPVAVRVSRQMKSWNLSLQKKGCACKHYPFHSFYRKYPVACPSPWYCLWGTYSSIALEFLSQYWLLSEETDFICMFGGRSSKNYYKKMSVPDLILQLSPENFGLFREAAVSVLKHEPG